MLKTIANLSLLGGIKACLEIAGQISGYAPQAADMDVLFADVAGWANRTDNPFKSTA
ncbi:hypothetical protein D3C77_620200 [compost metagenome]